VRHSGLGILQEAKVAFSQGVAVADEHVRLTSGTMCAGREYPKGRASLYCQKDKEAICTNKSTNVEFAGGLQPANLQEVSQSCPAETLLA
jgi:hypothetical protein